MVSIRRLLQLSPLLLTTFSPGLFIVLQEQKTFFCSGLTDYCKKQYIFKLKQIFSFNLLLVSFDLLFYVYVFLRALFHISCLHICIVSYSTSHQIIWHNKRIHGYGLKITSSFLFQGFEVDTTSIILSYIYHSGNVKKFRYC